MLISARTPNLHGGVWSLVRTRLIRVPSSDDSIATMSSRLVREAAAAARPRLRRGEHRAEEQDEPVGVLMVGPQWSQVIPNPRLCKALIDRLTDQAHIITTGTDSYRFRRTTAQRKGGKSWAWFKPRSH